MAKKKEKNPQDKMEVLQGRWLSNLLSGTEAICHLESFTQDETISFIPKCSGM